MPRTPLAAGEGDPLLTDPEVEHAFRPTREGGAPSPPPAPALSRFPPERTWLLPALLGVQAERGWLSLDDLAAVAEHLHVPRSEVYGVATHYPELRLAPRGTHLVRVCTGLSCRVRGGLDLLRGLERRLGLASGQTTSDGRWTLEETDCCFVCSVAPVVEVDHRYLSAPGVETVVTVGRRPCPPAEAISGLDPASPPGGGAPRDSALGAWERLAAGARSRRLAIRRLLVGLGSCGLARGAADTLAALRVAVAEAGLAATVEAGGCGGLCYAAPVVDVLEPDGARLTVERVGVGRVPALLALLRGDPGHGLEGAVWRDTPMAGLPPSSRHPAFGGQTRRLCARWGAIAPDSLDDALVQGSYATLARALDDGDPEAVIERVRAAGLLGRGGAYFPAAVKWEGCRRAAGEPKYLVVNGEEGEPGIFKDRHLMEADPHRLLEGMLLAAHAAGASRGILYVHGEAALAAERCARAVNDAYRARLLGPRVLGSAFAFEVEIRRGAGGFVLGEETALLESIEGRRAMPRPKPPFPVEAGVFGKPTVINNVETLAAVPLVVAGEAEAARTKLFGLSGHVLRPGVVEVAPPVTLRGLVEGLGGGLATGRPLGAVVVGGPSGVVVPPGRLDVPLERPALSPGTGGVVALDETVPVADVVRLLLGFNARESCGKCTPCREGTARMLATLDDLAAGRGGAADVVRLSELADAVQLASLCGLGQAAPLAFRAALEHFPEAFPLLARP